MPVPDILVQRARVPALGLGTYDLKGSVCEKAIETALELGYRHFDCAEMYANQHWIGNVLKRSSVPRQDLFITTKVWPASYEKTLFFKSVTKSLNDLKLDDVDLLLLHWPKDDQTNIRATDCLLECFEKGYAKHIGVSNFNMVQLKQAQSQAPIFCNQFKYHPYEKNDELVTYMQSQDMLITAYSPLETGSLKNDTALADIGKKYGKTASQTALRWLVQQKNVAAIPKAASKLHQQQNLDIFDFELSTEDMKTL